MEEAIKLHSKPTILIVSALLNPFVGGLLLAQNLGESGRRGKRAYPIIFGLLYNFITSRVLDTIPLPILPKYLLLNLIGGVILITIVWNENMEKGLSYKAKSPLWPFSLIVLLWGMVIAYILFKST